MIGAIVGDIVGSVYEFDNVKVKDFPLFIAGSTFTDDSIMTLSVAHALHNCRGNYTNLSQETIKCMQEMGKKYPYPKGGYGGTFGMWLKANEPRPYNSFGNGAAMRVSPVAYYSYSIDMCKELSRKVTEITHNHPEGIKGAECTAVLTWLAIGGTSKDDLREMALDYYPEIEELEGKSLDEIRATYHFDETCQGTVPQAIVCFLKSNEFEEAIRNAMWIGGDSDTLGAITGAIAGAYYGVPSEISRAAERRLSPHLLDILKE